MGMFDTVLIECPQCKRVIKEQTKSGDCNLRTYQLEDAPAKVLMGISDRYSCPNCGRNFRVRVKIVVLSAKASLITEDDDDFEEDDD
jgi:predicted RNA-binding Zn-ribbon protein involved in translation (DUF1610 family)